MKTYRLRKDFPGHVVGDILNKNEEKYEWASEPFDIIPEEIVEKYSDYFEEICNDFVKGEFIFFISTMGDVIDEIFEPSRHSGLVYFGNCFKTEEEAIWYRDIFYKILNDTDNLVVNRNEIVKILYTLDKDVETTKTLLQKLI